MNAIDRTRMLNNPKTFLRRATVENLYDANRDSLVNAVDRTIALNNSTTFVTDLNLFTVPDTAGDSALAAGSRSASFQGDSPAAGHAGSPDTLLLNELISAAYVWPFQSAHTFRSQADGLTHRLELLQAVLHMSLIVLGVESRQQPLISVPGDDADATTPAGSIRHKPGAQGTATPALQTQKALIDVVFGSVGILFDI